MSDLRRDSWQYTPFEVFVASPAGAWDAAIPIAAARAEAVGLLDLTFLSEVPKALREVRRLMRLARGRYGVILHGRANAVTQAAFAELRAVDTLLLTCEGEAELAAIIGQGRGVAQRIGLIVATEAEASRAARLGCDFVVGKGNEAGGRVGPETTFVLLQRLLECSSLPAYAWGGIGRHAAGACQIAGAAGVVLDWQLALTRESTFSAAVRHDLATTDRSRSTLVPVEADRYLRVRAPGDAAVLDKIRSLIAEGALEGPAAPAAIDETLTALMAQATPETPLWLLGEDARLAARWAAEAATVARALQVLRQHLDVVAQEASAAAGVFGPGSSLAQSHGTRLPVAQAPMIHVSDNPAFCEAVSEAGGLPFVAIGSRHPAGVRELLDQISRRMGSRPWGAGLTGFLNPTHFARQLDEVVTARPPFALIAGGRAEDARLLQSKGIATYLQVSAPLDFEAARREGVCRFVVQGCESGGLVGSWSSFCLWEAVVESLAAGELSPQDAAATHVLFAGGIHDRVSAAMASVMAQPLARRGIKVGVMMGTAYLFSEECARTGAVVPQFQQVALAAETTTTLDLGGDCAVRCAAPPGLGSLAEEKQRLQSDVWAEEELHEELVRSALARLETAAKGVTRIVATSPGEASLRPVPTDVQLREGLYAMGEVAALRKTCGTIQQLHEEVCQGAGERLRACRRESIRAASLGGNRRPLDIAIVGMACFLPGASSVEDFWSNILAKRDLLTEVPPDRFDIHRWYDADRHARDKTYSKWGGFVDDVFLDPLKFGIPPAALKSIEPGQLLTLALVERAMRDAGYLEKNPHKARTSVIFGVSGGLGDLGQDYVVRALLPQFFGQPEASLYAQLPEWTEDSFPGILPNIIAARVANRFDFYGENYTVDAACASSLAAVLQACRSLADGSSDMVIAGGCDLLQGPFAYLCFAKTGALSARGKPRVFDTGADGIVISEGLAAVVLKRREEAERDGDHIYAVIRAVTAGSDGRSMGITAPHQEGQQRTLRRAYEMAGFGPSTIGLFEAHGTGTAVGDVTEARALAAVLQADGAAPRQSAVGSVKSMIGHTKSSAGIVALIKAALALERRVLPPTLNVDHPNEEAGLVDGPLYVNSELRPWIRAAQPRRAGVSAFGFGGTNVHAVLEEYEGQPAENLRPGATRRWPAELFVFRAASAAELSSRVSSVESAVRAAVTAGAELELADLAFTIDCQNHAERSAGRSGSAAACRAAVVAAGVGELLDQLAGLAAALRGVGAAAAAPLAVAKGVYCSLEPIRSVPPVAFLFPGQGAQFPGMMGDLAMEFSEVADCFAEADAVLAGCLNGRLSDYVFPIPAFTSEERGAAAKRLEATDVAQPAMGVCGLALHRLLATMGVRPAMVAGHSYGELVALCVAGCYDEPELYRLSRARGEAIAGLVGSRPPQGPDPAADLGGMLAARAESRRVEDCIAGCSDVWIANYNSPQQVVLSGTRAGLGRAQEKLREAGVEFVPLEVAAAFHSPLIFPARQQFEQVLQAMEFGPLRLPVFSNASGEVYPHEPAKIRELLGQQLVSRVNFVQDIEAMYAAGARVFLELGPSRLLVRFVDQVLGDRPHQALALQARGVPGVTQMLHALAAAMVSGVEIATERLYQSRQLREIDCWRETARARRGRPPHLWVVNGGKARPVAQAKAAATADAAAEPVAALAAAPAAPVIPVPSAASAPVPPMVPSPPSRSTAQTGAPALQPLASTQYQADSMSTTQRQPPDSPQFSALADAYGQFQETMRKFLASQQRVFEGLLQSYGAGGNPVPKFPPQMEPGEPLLASFPSEPRLGAASTVTAILTTAAPPAGPTAPLVPPRKAEDDPPAKDANPAAWAGDLAELLLRITSDRTGYPTEVLTLDSSLEADLGIDSIKRVEVIASFRTAAVPSVKEPPAEVIERLTAARTLRAILEAVRDFRDRQQALPALAAPVPAAPSALATPPRTTRANPPARTANPAVTAGDLAELLLRITSDRTGYPTEVLTLDSSLEADLGIDSIKRVEVIASFRTAAVPAVKEPPAEVIERLTAARTLRAILEAVRDFRDRQQALTVSAELPAPAEADAEPPGPAIVGKSAPRYVGRAVEISGDDLQWPTTNHGALVLIDDDRGTASAVTQAAEARGWTTVVLSHDVLRSAESTAEALQEVRRRRGAIAMVLNLLPLSSAPQFPEIDERTWAERSDLELKGMLYLLQAMAAELATSDVQPVCVAAVSRGGGDFAAAGEAEAIHPWRGGLAGMLKTAAKEWPAARFRVVDVDEVPPAAALLDECLRSGPVEIGLRRGRRLAIEPIPLALADAEAHGPKVELTRTSVVLITGGAQGITAEVAREIAERSQATLILLGRSPLPEREEARETSAITEVAELRRAVMERMLSCGGRASPREVEAEVQRLYKDREIRRTLAALGAAGSEAWYLPCDVRDGRALEAALEKINRRYGGVDVLVHGAGVIEDCLIVEKAAASFDRVVQTKVAPMLTFARRLDPARLKAVLLFSSISGFFGNPGQADYAAANEILNRIARRLADLWPGKVAAINWGPWVGAGMVRPEVAQRLELSGYQMISVAAGRHAAWREIVWNGTRDARIVVGTVAPAAIAGAARTSSASSGTEPGRRSFQGVVSG